MIDVSDKLQVGLDGSDDCVSADNSTHLQIVVWAGGEQPADRSNCEVEHQSCFYIAALNDSIVEEEMSYDSTCQNRALTFQDTRRPKQSGKMYIVPYRLRSPRSHPQFSVHRLVLHRDWTS